MLSLFSRITELQIKFFIFIFFNLNIYNNNNNVVWRWLTTGVLQLI